MVLLALASVPELEVWIQAWSFFETIHSRSYSYLIRNVYPNPSIVFDEMRDIPEIVGCADDISRHYDELLEASQLMDLFGEGTHVLNGETVVVSKYELKRKLWRALNSVNVLEGIRFYVSFACSWAFAERKLMEGNAKIIKMIARDENLHLSFTIQMLRELVKVDPDFAKIAAEEQDFVVELFRSAVEQEKEWANFLFKDGSMVGLNTDILHHYIEWIGNRRMTSLGLTPLWKGGSNPLPWTMRWIGGQDVQVAPQETEVTQYTIGAIVQDVDDSTFQGFTL